MNVLSHHDLPAPCECAHASHRQRCRNIVLQVLATYHAAATHYEHGRWSVHCGHKFIVQGSPRKFGKAKKVEDWLFHVLGR